MATEKAGNAAPEPSFEESSSNESTSAAGNIRKEAAVSPKVVGRIIHEALGISFAGESVQPKTQTELLRDYSRKEVSYALKAAILSESMSDLAAEVEPGKFEPLQTAWLSYAGPIEFDFIHPSTLKDEFGELDQMKLKIYLEKLIGDHANQVGRGPFRTKYPEAFATLCEVDGIRDPETEDLMEALDVGLDILLAFYWFIKAQVPPHLIGQTYANSLPVIYKLAFQDVFISQVAIVPNITTDIKDNPKKEIYRSRVRSELQSLSPIYPEACRVEEDGTLVLQVQEQTWRFPAEMADWRRLMQ